MSAASASRRLVTDAVRARLAQLVATTAAPGVLPGPKVSVYVGEVPANPPLATVGGVEDPEERVAPYAVLYPTAGDVDRNPALSMTPNAHGSDLVWSCQITFVAGRVADLEYTLDRAFPLLHGYAPQLAGLACGPLRPDGPPGAIRRDDNVKPPRFYVPTLWTAHVASLSATP